MPNFSTHEKLYTENSSTNSELQLNDSVSTDNFSKSVPDSSKQPELEKVPPDGPDEIVKPPKKMTNVQMEDLIFHFSDVRSQHF